MTQISMLEPEYFSAKAQKIKRDILYCALQCRNEEDIKGFDYYIHIYSSIKFDSHE